MIRSDFRGEIIQINRQIGFANFLEYQNRKEYFIEGEKAYEDELVRLALNESLRRSNMVSLEARICPKNTSHSLYKTLKNYGHIVDKYGEADQERKDSYYDKLIYVFHFPKLMDGPFVRKFLHKLFAICLI